MSSQYDPIIEQLLDGNKVVINQAGLCLKSFRTAFYRANKKRKEEWGDFYKDKTLCVQKEKPAKDNIPKLVLFLIDKPPKPVYHFSIQD